MPMFPPTQVETSLISLWITRKNIKFSQNIGTLWGLVSENRWNWIQITFIYPIFWIWQTKLHLQFLGSHFLIFSLKIFKVALFLISVGTMLHTSELNTLKEFRPYWLVLTELLRNAVCHLTLYLWLSLVWSSRPEVFC